jgi:hypothetical protein
MPTGPFLTVWAAVEPWLVLAAVAALVVLAADTAVADPCERRSAGVETALAATSEPRLLVVVVALALTVRVIGWRSAWTPAWWFSETPVLWIDKMLRDGTLWATWTRQLSTRTANFAHDATAVLPLLAGLQALMGPQFGLGVLAGGLVGTLSVILAWVLGRTMRSPVFGLVLAAFVAFSPLQLMWSRTSAMCAEAVAHVMLALLVAYLAGRRGSFLLALATGVVAWTSLQQYYAARASLPIALIGIVAGAQRALRPARGVVLVLVAAVTFAAVDVAVTRSPVGASMWPTYAGYAGNRGEASLVDVVERNWTPVTDEARATLGAYFVRRRAGWEGDAYTWGLENGGLCPLGFALLGLVGIVAAARRFDRHWPWFALAAIGFAMPALSKMTARRALVFDVAWCAFAAHGLLALVDGLGRRYSPAVRGRVAVAIVAVFALWSTSAVFGLSAALPSRYGVYIPFGDAGFGDGVTCRRCLDVAKGWQRDIAGGAFVVLFDNDTPRENRTGPGGLRAYGKLAALAAGTPSAFVDAYALMADWDVEPPMAPMFDRYQTNFAEELAARIEGTRARRIVWHFERPTAWERWLAARLASAGSDVETFATPLGPEPGIRLTTPWERRDEALAAIRELAAGLEPSTRACFTLVDRGTARTDDPVLVLAGLDPGAARTPEWLTSGWSGFQYGPHRLATRGPAIGAHVEGSLEAQRLEVIDIWGNRTRIDLPSLRRVDSPANVPGAKPYGLNCAAYVDGHWWVIEPATGHVLSTHPAASAVPAGAWIGIAAGPADELILASADQTIMAFDAAAAVERARFAARVPPTVRDSVDECTPVVAGDGWIGIANLRSTVLSLYTIAGEDLGAQRLDDPLLGHVWAGLATIGATGRYLAVQADGIRTFEVRIDPSCVAVPAATR